MGLINFLYTIGKIAKARYRAAADVAEDVAKVNQLGKVRSNFFMQYHCLLQVVNDPPLPMPRTMRRTAKVRTNSEDHTAQHIAKVNTF